MTGTSSGTPDDQYTVTDAGGLGEFYLGPYAQAGNWVEVIDIPGGDGKIEVAIEVVPHTYYAAYDGEGGMSSVTTPLQPPPVELPDTAGSNTRSTGPGMGCPGSGGISHF
jgi:hypothetical protein